MESNIHSHCLPLVSKDTSGMKWFFFGGGGGGGVHRDFYRVNSLMLFRRIIGSFSSSPPEVFVGKGILKICSKFIGKNTHAKV